ncbi:MAG: hypothetical protein LBD45_04710 [Bacteroidales bacterium]|jgi:hypothetical protein|nr:hypothetical protein [Bacteroidales bacterium]
MEFQDIKTTQHNQILDEVNTQGIIVSIVMVIAGIVIFFIPSLLETEKSSVTMLLFTIAFCLVLAGILFFYAKRKYKIYDATGARLVSKTYSFDRNDVETVKEILEKGSVEGRKTVAFLPNSDHCLEVIASVDDQFAAAQLKSYVHFVFLPMTPTCYFEDSAAESFIKYLKLCEKQ